MELLRIVTTTQMVALYITLIVMFIIIRHFKEALIKIMGRPATIKTGNVEANINQSPSIERPPENIDDIKMLKDKLLESSNLTDSARQNALAAVELAIWWKFRYLDIFLAPKTQFILDRIAEAGEAGAHFQNLLNTLSIMGESGEQITAIETALLLNGLVVRETPANIYKITETGEEYRRRRNPPPFPPVSPSVPTTPPHPDKPDNNTPSKPK